MAATWCLFRLLTVLITLIGVDVLGIAADLPQQGDDAQLWTCGTNVARQTWTVEGGSGRIPQNHIVLTHSRNSTIGPNDWLVLDIAGWSNDTGGEIHVWYNDTGSSVRALVATDLG